jgi:hypothetical protein
MTRPHSRLLFVAPILWLSTSACARGQDDRAACLYPAYGIGGTRGYGYIDRAGRMVARAQFEAAEPFHEGLGAVCLGGKWGFVDGQGELVIQPHYDAVTPFYQGASAAAAGGKWNFIDRTGRALTTAGFVGARPFSEGMAAVTIGNRWGYLGRDTEIVIEPRFEAVGSFTEGLAPARADGRWGFIDRSGSFVIPAQYYWVDNFCEGLAFVEGGAGREGYIDKQGNLVVARRFWAAQPFSSGVAAVVLEPGAGCVLIDKAAKAVTEAQYDEIGLFSDGLAMVRNGVQHGFIDPSGTPLIEAKLDRAASFHCGLAEVLVEGKWRYIDRTGEVIWEQPRPDPTAAPPPSPPPAESLPPEPAGIRGVGAASVSVIGNPHRSRFPDDSPNVFSRSIWDMMLYQRRIYTGGGDLYDNTGPVDIYSFAPGEGELRLEYTAPDEMVSRMYVFEDKLVIPSDDPKEGWEFANLYIKDAEGWHQKRTLPNGLHCLSLAFADGALLAFITTEHLPKVLRSLDWGDTWEDVVFHDLPRRLFSHQGKLFSTGAAGVSRLEEDLLVPLHLTTRWEVLAHSAPVWFPQVDNVVSFGEGVLLLGWTKGNGPDGWFESPWYLASVDSEPTPIEALTGECITDAIVRDNMLYVLCARKAQEGYENLVFGTKDVRNWWCVLSFSNEAYAVSLEEADGRFFVGLGCGFQTKRGMPAPKTAGDIVYAVPAPGRLDGP